MVADREFEPWSDQTIEYKIGICCFSAKYTSLGGKSKMVEAENNDIFS
jgi:hypothetical protein